MTDLGDRFRGRNVLITGGLGMIGSTIALKLHALGAHIVLVDACLEPYGANPFNIEAIRDSVTLNICDIRDRAAMKWLLKGQRVVFNLAGQVSHNDSMSDPFLDADINYLGHLNVLECLRQVNPEAVVVHAGSRLQFGRIEAIPVAESHPLRPRTPYAVNKTAAEVMYRFFHESHGIRCVLLRLSNPYGPRSQMRHSKYSMVNWFLRLAMAGGTIKVFGDGSQLRDYIFVDDVAEALIRASVSEACMGETLNVGSGVATSFREMAETVVATVGKGQVELVPWPSDYVNVETGDYVADIRKIGRATGWTPATDLGTGVRRTFDYYVNHLQRYC